MGLRVLILALLLGTVTGCGAVLGPTAGEMTLQAQNSELGTQVAYLSSTATVEVDRMMVTVEHASTEVRAVAIQRDRLRATLQARGTDVEFLDLTQPQIDDLPDGISPDQLLGANDGVNPAVAPPVTPPGADVVPPAPGGADAAAGTPVPDAAPGGLQVLNPTLTTGVDSNDCAINSQTSFGENTVEIYLVTRAVSFPVGTTVTTRWAREGEVVASFPFTYDFAIDDACIWSFIDQTDVAFTPGNWSVAMDVNGQPTVGPISFTITGTAPAEPDVMEEPVITPQP